MEKNEFRRGKCTTTPIGDYVVDTGVHMFGGADGPFGQIARIVGEGPSGSVQDQTRR